ncbi:MAG: response regulator [Pseudomonadota bacterium]|jgi:two-component system KDP operon response regulator KdpE
MTAIAPHAAQILLVEDDPTIRRFVRVALEDAGYTVHDTDSLKRGQIDAATRRPDLIIVDLGLPDGDGKGLITEVRSWSDVPILVLSARDQEREKVAALDAGADDYLTKPFGVDELLARLRALLRRHANTDATTLVRFDDVQVDFSRHEVRKRGQPVHLTPIEFRLLAALVRAKGAVVTYRQLLMQVWGPGHADRTHYVRVHMANLRQKLEDDPAQPRHLITELQVGYRFIGT